MRFGQIARDDPDAEVRIAQLQGKQWVYIERQFIQGKKKMKFDLKPGKYHVGVFGNKVAGVATTGGMDVPFPFNVFLDPPEDHSKDYLRVSVPAKKADTVADAVKRTLH